MATIKELTDENTNLKAQIVDLQAEIVRHKAATTAVEGIIHQVDNHDATPKDLRDAIVTLKAKRAVANTKPVIEPVDPEVIV